MILPNFSNLMIFSTFVDFELAYTKISAHHKMCKFLQKSEEINAKWV